MKILIITSKDHIYANYVLKKLTRSSILDSSSVIVFEQDWIIPNKTKLEGLVKYLRVAGVNYTASQAAKQYLFLICRYFSTKWNKRNSPFYPYYINQLPYFYRRPFKGLRSQSAIEYIQDINPDLIISIFSKEIIPDSIIQIPKHGCINLHPALVPFYRGVSPIFWCLANGEQKTGVTLHCIDTSIDTGPIISQKEILITEFKTEHLLYMHCANVGTDLVIDFLKQLSNNPNLPLRARENPKNGSYYSLPSKEAVKKFRRHGYRFFRFYEFVSGSS